MVNKKISHVVIGLFFLSGCLALVYEILWLKELKLLFGSTIQAASVTVAAFFLGLSAGGFFWGSRAPNIANLLRAYGLLEVGIGLTAGLYFFMLRVYQSIYNLIFQFAGELPLLLVLTKLTLAMTMLFLPAFFMGGTLPVLGQFFIRRPNRLAEKGTFLYAVNTAGAVLGVWLAGFMLPPVLGYTRSYLVAMLASVLVGFVAIKLGKEESSVYDAGVSLANGQTAQIPDASLRPVALYVLAFVSGFLALAMQIFWTRMFSQVLQNTVYSFSVILSVFLSALTLGAVLANRLSHRKLPATQTTVTLLAASGFTCGLTPWLFTRVTEGTKGLMFFGSAPWHLYLLAVLGAAILIILIPGMALGSVFPYLLKAAESPGAMPGRIIGHLMGVNTVGAILGSLAAGFIFLGQLGLWWSIKLVCIAYLIAGLATLFVLSGEYRKSRKLTFALVGVLVLALLLPADFPLVYLKPNKNAKLLGVFEGPVTITSVIQHKTEKNKDYLRMYINNKYSAGGTLPSGMRVQMAQSGIPLMLHANPKSLFYLGLGTGITAGTALASHVEKVTVCELVPEVVEASRKFFADYCFGLYEDKRARVFIEDGRNYLLGRKETYDLIISDLFLPWKAGVGNLYTLEHFKNVKSRLKTDGLFVQWLAMYQLSNDEFYSIVRTVLEVFEQVTLWRTSYSTTRPALGLICSNSNAPLNPKVMLESHKQDRLKKVALPPERLLFWSLMKYCGNLTSNSVLFKNHPMNTDDRPIIEFTSPISYQNRVAKLEKAMTGELLFDFLKGILNGCPPEKDPFLQQLDQQQKTQVCLGLKVYQLNLLKYGNPQARSKYQNQISDILFRDLKRPFPCTINRKEGRPFVNQ
jgi:spermidine synthase